MWTLKKRFVVRTNFLNVYQVISAILKALATKARNQGKPIKYHNTKIQLAQNIDIDLQKTKAKDFYWLLNKTVNYSFLLRPKKWSNTRNLNPPNGNTSSNSQNRFAGK